jgi:hypothetical protein
MSDRESLLNIAKAFSGKDKDHLIHVAMFGTASEQKAKLYEAEEVQSGRRKYVNK